jgi:hypothetical protein
MPLWVRALEDEGSEVSTAVVVEDDAVLLGAACAAARDREVLVAVVVEVDGEDVLGAAVDRPGQMGHRDVDEATGAVV